MAVFLATKVTGMKFDKDWDLTRLHIFRTVAVEGSLTRAGAVLALPQPAVSRQIAKFESECGGRLFQRTGRGVKLTELGERVYPPVESILNDARVLADVVDNSAENPVGEVRIATLPSLYMSLVVPLFLKLRKLHPGVLLHVFEGSAGQIDSWLATGFIDIGLPYRYGEQFSPDVHPLVTVPSCLLGPAGDRITSQEVVRFSEIDNLPLVLPGSSSSVRSHLKQLAKQSGIRLNVVIEADSTQLQARITRDAGAYTILPPHSVLEELATGKIQASRIVEPAIDRTIVLGLSAARPTTLAIREVTKHVRQMMSSKEMITRLHGRDPAPSWTR